MSHDERSKMAKLLSVIVPSYNAVNYLTYCVKSLVIGGTRVEILIVNDGSSDATQDLAEQLASQYPDIVSVISQENKGHGGAVNTGLAHASGKYIKVVDSDDWVDTRAYLTILDKLTELEEAGTSIDAMITNFVYEKEMASFKKVMHYRGLLPENRSFGWSEIKPFPKGKYLMMHALIYRTDLLRACDFCLPEHTFYVDNLFVFQPLQTAQTLYYLDVDFYRYLIGRDEQSVNEEVMIRRIDQQLRVNRLLIQSYDETRNYSPHLAGYLKNHLEITTVISSALLNRAGTPEHLAKKQELWEFLKVERPALYQEFSKSFLGNLTKHSHYTGRKISNVVYRITQKIYGFN